MRISSSAIQMDAQWSQSINKTSTENLQVWNDADSQRISAFEGLKIDISEEGRKLYSNLTAQNTQSISKDEASDLLSDKEKEKIKLLEDFIYVLSGKRIKIMIPSEKLKELKKVQQAQPNATNPPDGAQGPQRLGWGLRYDFQETLHEKESMSFSSKGSVTTADGRSINFNLSFSVSREFIRHESLSIRAGDALIDPLVINFKNASAQLGDRNYSFDIDLDGKNDTIAFTQAGSGFLALDRNGNNHIDDGSELFGPQTGNGFGELVKYDQDNNGWIDENDPIFDKLRIWTLDEQGNKTLFALGKVGVGAIYLGNVESSFNIKTASNEHLGHIARTGIYLNENGTAGTIQHVNLVI